MSTNGENLSFSNENNMHSAILVRELADLFTQTTQFFHSHTNKNNNETRLYHPSHEQAEPEDLLWSLLADTSVYQTIGDDSGYLNDNLCDSMDALQFCNTDYSVQESMLPSLGSEVLNCCPMISRSSESSISSFESNQVSTQNLLSPCKRKVLPSLSDERPTSYISFTGKSQLDAKIPVTFIKPKLSKKEPLKSKDMFITKIKKQQSSKRRKCECPNCNVENGNKTRDSNGKLLHACHILGCGKVFYHTGYLRKHLSKHVTGTEYKKCNCPNCNAEGGNKNRYPDGNLQHVCHISNCGKIFRFPAPLRKHLDWHNGKTNFVCAQCDKKFLYKSSLRTHIQMHMSDRPQYVCRIPECGKVFTNKGHLKRHLNLHSGKKPFVCAHCNKEFSSRSDLIKHVTIHMTERRKYVCHILGCEQVFIRTANFKRHLNRHNRCDGHLVDCSADGVNKISSSKDKPLQLCYVPQLEKISSRVGGLEKHSNSHSDRQTFVCVLYNRGFLCKDSFQEHIKSYVDLNFYNQVTQKFTLLPMSFSQIDTKGTFVKLTDLVNKTFPISQTVSEKKVVESGSSSTMFEIPTAGKACFNNQDSVGSLLHTNIKNPQYACTRG